MEGLFGSGNWLYIILIGFIVGVLARLLKPGKDSMGIILTTLLGIAGALLAGWVGQATGLYEAGEAAGLIGAVVRSEERSVGTECDVRVDLGGRRILTKQTNSMTGKRQRR